MADSSLRSLVKEKLPDPVRLTLRGCLNYVYRIGLWFIILRQVRGLTCRDQWTLIRSALASPFIAFRDLLKWQDPVLLADAQVKVTDVGQFQLRKLSDDLWHVLPWREKAIFKAISLCLRPGDIFIDAGANIGVYTVLASKIIGPSGRVISVEMIPDTADQLEKHIHLNGLHNVTVVRNALSDTTGKKVTAYVEIGKYGQATISEANEADKVLEQIQVSTTTLDNISNAIPMIRLMKMDLEGMELPALVGAQGVLQRLEFLIFERRGDLSTELNSVDTYLKDFGFKLDELDDNNCLARRERNDA